MAETLGVDPIVLLESLYKRLVDASAGRGGIEALVQFFDQLDFVGVADVRERIKNASIFYETALAKCRAEMLKRPLAIRQREAVDLLGCGCAGCGHVSGLWGYVESGGVCPSCGGELRPLYAQVLGEMAGKRMTGTPEAVLMYEAYRRLADAYVDAYRALYTVANQIAATLGWRRFKIGQPELRRYLDEHFYGRLAGEQKIPREEKQVLQFLVRGVLADIPPEEAEELIRLGIDVVRYGYLYQVLGVAGAGDLYMKSLAGYTPLYDHYNSRIRTALAALYAEEAGRRRVRITGVQEGRYAPVLQVYRRDWEAGHLGGELTLKPLYNLPVYPRADMGSLQAIWGRLGSGKTILLSSLISQAVLERGEFVFAPLNDKSNSLSLAGLPLFAYDRRTRSLLQVVEGILSAEPQALPTLTVTVLRKGEKPPESSAHAPTRWDRILEVEDPRSFQVDFARLREEAAAVAEDRGLEARGCLICVRNLDRYDAANNVNVDVQAAANMLVEFDRWRKAHPKGLARVTIDEVSYLASATVALYSGDAYRSGATISDFIKESRRNMVSIDLASQLPLEVIPDIRNAATNVFFRDLASSRDKGRSQIDALLEAIQLNDPNLKPVIRDMNNRGLLGRGYWFWYHQPTREVEVVRVTPPAFMVHDPKLTHTRLLRLYQKQAGEQVLLKSWREVPRIRASPRAGKEEEETPLIR